MSKVDRRVNDLLPQRHAAITPELFRSMNLLHQRECLPALGLCLSRVEVERPPKLGSGSDYVCLRDQAAFPYLMSAVSFLL